MNLKSNVKVVICALMVAIALSACSSKKQQPVGNFHSVECRTICNNGACTQQCIGASGDYYAK